jgi:hypothetical protein
VPVVVDSALCGGGADADAGCSAGVAGGGGGWVAALGGGVGEEGVAGVVGCGWLVAVVGSWVVSVVTCVTGGAGLAGAGLTGGVTVAGGPAGGELVAAAALGGDGGAGLTFLMTGWETLCAGVAGTACSTVGLTG